MDGSGQAISRGLHRIVAPLGDRFIACYVVTATECSLLVTSGEAEMQPGQLVRWRFDDGSAR
jgi:hypothetical protein